MSKGREEKGREQGEGGGESGKLVFAVACG